MVSQTKVFCERYVTYLDAAHGMWHMKQMHTDKFKQLISVINLGKKNIDVKNCRIRDWYMLAKEERGYIQTYICLYRHIVRKFAVYYT